MKSADQLWARLKEAAEELAVTRPGLTYTQAEQIVLQFSRSSGEPLSEDARVYLSMQLLNQVAKHRRRLLSADPQARP
ncbi:MAG TPA: hypothetical protein VFW34_07420 [Candidatus Rubrimentiphilum sp.]|nr:hypothetical protein [Candidatus Rubrimentiphilum sp.]